MPPVNTSEMVPVMTSLNLATGIFAEVTEATTQSTLVHQTGDEWSGSGYWIWRPETEEVLTGGRLSPQFQKVRLETQVSFNFYSSTPKAFKFHTLPLRVFYFLYYNPVPRLNCH